MGATRHRSDALRHSPYLNKSSDLMLNFIFTVFLKSFLNRYVPAMAYSLVQKWLELPRF